MLKWAMENGASLVLDTPANSISLREFMLQMACFYGHLPVVKWLISEHSTLFDYVNLRAVLSCGSKSIVTLETLVARYGEGNVFDAISSAAAQETFYRLLPDVIEWCSKRGVHFDAEVIQKNMEYTASESGSAQEIEGYLRCVSDGAVHL